MHLAMIVAVDQNNGIGKNGNQPFFISNDLKRFKALTTGHTVVMGRKTFEALPKGALPNRRNVVLTRDSAFEAPGVEVVHQKNALQGITSLDEKVFVMGGGEIYKLFLPEAETIFLTRVDHSFEGIDTWFPDLKRSQWREKEVKGPFTDDKSGCRYSFVEYERISEKG